MKRINNLYPQIYSIENLELADKIARKHKGKQKGILIHDKNREANILSLHEMLKNKTYKTSKYIRFTIQEIKTREIFKLPFFPDRIVHHAVMNILEDMFVSTSAKDLIDMIQKVPSNEFPFTTTIVKKGERYEFI